jgi:hypothetical protein
MQCVHLIEAPVRQYILVTQRDDLELLFEQVQKSEFEPDEPYRSLIKNIKREDVWFLQHKGEKPPATIIVVILHPYTKNTNYIRFSDEDDQDNV